MGGVGSAWKLREAGSSAVTFVLALPILAVFLCCAIDFGRVVFLNMALEDAAHAACQEASQASSRLEGGVAEEAVRAAVFAEAPALGADGLDVSVRVGFGEPHESLIPHHVSEGGGKGHSVRHFALSSRQIEAEVTLSGRFLTPVGAAALALQGQDPNGGFTYRASAMCAADAPVGGLR